MTFLFLPAALSVLIFALGSLSNLVQGWQIERHEQEERERAPNETSRYGNQDKSAIRVLAASIDSIADQFHAYKNQQKRDESGRALREKIIIVVGIIVAAFAGASAWVFYLQLKAMQEDQRPWIGPVIAPNADIAFMWGSDHHRVEVLTMLVIHNWGKSPGLNVRRHILALVDERQLDMFPEQACELAIQKTLSESRCFQTAIPPVNSGL